MLLQELVAHAGVDRFQVSDRALREGLVLAALGQPVPSLGGPEDLRRRQVLRVAERADTVYRHNLQTAASPPASSTSPPRSTASAAASAEWLEYAALLHDIGYSIHYRGHHKHAYYLISNAVLDAFDPRRSRSSPMSPAITGARHRSPSHPTLAALKPWQQRIIRKLAALLRVADALDRTHASRVEEIYGSIRPRKGHPGGRLALRRRSRAGSGAGSWQVSLKESFGCALRLRQGLEVAAG